MVGDTLVEKHLDETPLFGRSLSEVFFVKEFLKEYRRGEFPAGKLLVGGLLVEGLSVEDSRKLLGLLVVSALTLNLLVEESLAAKCLVEGFLVAEFLVEE